MNLREKFFEQIQCEKYDEFLSRVFSFEKAEFSFGTSTFNPNCAVSDKVDCDGRFKQYIGDTTVFNLKECWREFIQTHYIEALYNVAGEHLAERFDTDTLHMTLHDINSASTNSLELAGKMLRAKTKLIQQIEENKVESQSITMRTTCVFNMVNISLVLGLVPDTEEDYIKLISLYNLVESVHKLPYPLTPHITLAYYRPSGFDGEVIRRLEEVINELNRSSFKIVVSTDELYYQKFSDMNNFDNVFSFAKS